MSVVPIREGQEPEPNRQQRELLLLRTVYRAASAYLNAPYLGEHEQSLREAVRAYYEFKAGR